MIRTFDLGGDMKFVFFAVAAAISAAAPSSFADIAHCHMKNSNGTLSDYPSATNPAECAREHGLWLHHDAHCKQKDSKGKLVDILGVRDQKTCVSKGGRWEDHTHDGTRAKQ
jgi:hypothetical protein